MVEQTEGSPAQRSSFRIGRWLVVVGGISLLLAGVWLQPKHYWENLRLLKVVERVDRQDVAASISWEDVEPEMLERWIGRKLALALCSHPISLSIQGKGEHNTDESVRELLRESYDLNQVIIPNRPLPLGCLELLATRHKIKALQFRFGTITPNDATWLSQLKSLNELSIHQQERQAGQNDWSWLKKMPELFSLEATLTNASDHDVIELGGCSTTRYLDVRGAELTDGALETLHDHPNLRYLVLADAPRLKLHFQPGHTFPKSLQDLEIHLTGTDESSLASIEGLPVLDSIIIKGGGLTNESLEVLARLPRLTHLTLLDMPQVTDTGLEKLAASKSLETIFLRGLGISSQSIVHLLALPHWKSIEIGRDQFFRRENDVVHRKEESLTTVKYETLDEFLSSQTPSEKRSE